MKLTTLSFTLEVEDHINPLLLSDAVVQTLELCGAEVLEDSGNCPTSGCNSLTAPPYYLHRTQPIRFQHTHQSPQ